MGCYPVQVDILRVYKKNLHVHKIIFHVYRIILHVYKIITNNKKLGIVFIDFVKILKIYNFAFDVIVHYYYYYYLSFCIAIYIVSKCI